jgi:hypothetical protein
MLISVTAAVEVLLAAYGLVRTPSAADGAGLIALAAVIVAQLACVVVARWGPVSVRRAPAGTIAAGARVGAVTGGAYAVLVIAEYLVPAVTSESTALMRTMSNASGYLIVAALVVAACVAGVLGAGRSSTLRGGVTAAVWAAIVEYLVWYPAVLITYYAFYDTAVQERWLRAEGVYEDMQRSGMTDIKAFAIQDFYGAGFFHLLAGAVLALIFGTGAAALTTRIRRTRVKTVTAGNA